MDGGLGESTRTVEIVSCFRLYSNVVFCVQVRRPYSLTSFIHSASLRSFTSFASPVKSDGCATPSFFAIITLCCGWGLCPRWFIERSYPSQGGGTPSGAIRRWGTHPPPYHSPRPQHRIMRNTIRMTHHMTIFFMISIIYFE